MTKLPSNIFNIINYLRRSRQDEEREKRTGEDTLSEQKALMDRVLSQYEGVIYEQRFEIGSGDKIETRPVFKQILKELEQGKFNAIAVKEMSRLGRGSYTDQGIIFDLIQRHRIYIITPYKVYDPKNTADLRQIRFEIFLSREEFETTRERLSGAKMSYAMQGKWMAGRVPYGYKFNENTQRLEIEDEHAKIVRMIYDFYINQDIGYHAIATRLNKMGILSPTGLNNWRQQVIRYVLTKEAYFGQINFRRTELTNDGKKVKRPKEEWIVVDNAHPPIIDKEIWDKAQDKMNQNKKKHRTNTEHNPTELSGIVTCSKCGRKMIRHMSDKKYTRKDGTKVTYDKEYFWCHTYHCTTVSYKRVREALIQYIEQRINMPDSDLLDEISLSQKNEETLINKEDMQELFKKKEKELKERKQFVFYQFEVAKNYTVEMFKERMAVVQKEEKELEMLMNEENEIKSDQNNGEDIDITAIKNNLIKFLTTYNEMKDNSLKSEMLKNLFKYVGIEVTEKGSGRRPSKFELTIAIDWKWLQ